MTLWVHATGAYRADVGSKWRDADFNVRNLVKALKGEPFKGYSNIQFTGKTYSFSAANTAPAYEVWSHWAASALSGLELGRVTLVPVPSSGQVQYGQITSPVKMGNALAALMPKQEAVVGNFLRHRTQQPKAHRGGSSWTALNGRVQSRSLSDAHSVRPRDDGDDRLAEVLVLHARRAPKAARTRHVAAVCRRSGSIGRHGVLLRFDRQQESLPGLYVPS